VPSLDVLPGAVDEDVLGDQFLELSDLPRLVDPKVATDDIRIALADGFG
jgi:hypothetical protein